MFKSSGVALVSTVLGIGALVAVSGSAFAWNDTQSTYCKRGFYAGVEAGVDNTHYDAADLLSEARTANIYNTGISSLTTPYNPIFINGNVDDQGVGGRIFAGYQYNPFFAVEAGFTQFHKTTFVGAADNVISRKVSGGTSSSFDQYSGELTEHAIDVVGKLTYPMQYGFGVFAKLGAAFIASDRHINTTLITSGGSAIPQNTFYTKSYQAIRPTYGAGIDYTIPNSSLDVDVAYSEIAGGGGISRAGLISLGISEKFA